MYVTPPLMCHYPKKDSDQWKDLGPFTHACVNTRDWQPTQDKTISLKPVWGLYSWHREQHCYSMSMTSWFEVLLMTYFSAKLDPVAAGLPRCHRESCDCFQRNSDVTLLVPHAVSVILLEQKTSHLSTAWWLRYNTVLLDMANIHLKRCTVLNPATFIPLPGDGEEHNMFVDGSALLCYCRWIDTLEKMWLCIFKWCLVVAWQQGLPSKTFLPSFS